MKYSSRKLMPYLSAVLLLVLVLWTIWGNTALEANEYVIQSSRIPSSFSGFRIAQVSDLHNAELGDGNSELLQVLSGTDPDIIVITGDLVDSQKTDTEIALAFARAAVDIAPVYYISGNHEARISEYELFKTGLETAGVTVLDNRKVTLEREGEHITLIGLDDPSFLADYLFDDSASVTASVLKELQAESDGYTILLAHRPELFDTYAASGVDLVFSGHAHGGQFRLPMVGGLFAPNQGFLPEYDAGLFTMGNTNMIVSRGVGNSIIPMRFNNRPEIILAVLENTP